MKKNGMTNFEKDRAQFVSRIQKVINALAGIEKNFYGKKYSIEIASILLKLCDMKQSVRPAIKEYKGNGGLNPYANVNGKEDCSNNTLDKEGTKKAVHSIEKSNIVDSDSVHKPEGL